jgi:hypothetical protein
MSGWWLAAGSMDHAWGQSVSRLGSYQRCTILDYFTALELPSTGSRQRPAAYARILLLRAAEDLSSSMALSARRAAEAGNRRNNGSGSERAKERE